MNNHSDKGKRAYHFDEITGGGRKIKIEFSDSEVVIGYTLSYSPDRHGFFMTPAELKGNVAQAAELAGKYRADLYELLKKHGLSPSQFRNK